MFAAMIDALFESPLAVDAIYTAPASGAVAVAVRAMRRVESSDIPLGMPGVVGSANAYDVRVSEVAIVEEGAILEIVDGASFVVRSRTPDEEHLVWQMDLDPT